MKKLSAFLNNSGVAHLVQAEQFTWIDLSHNSLLVDQLSLLERETTEAWFNANSSSKNALYGGYMEKRAWYGRNPGFVAGQDIRNIHLGIDIWMPAETPVFAPLAGKVHSKANNNSIGDYGYTVILEHHLNDTTLYTLYGHLGAQGFHEITPGQAIASGQQLGVLGAWEENGGWPAHVHFQCMWDMDGKEGDYPGVCFESEQKKYANLCPDPRILIKGIDG